MKIINDGEIANHIEMILFEILEKMWKGFCIDIYKPPSQNENFLLHIYFVKCLKQTNMSF